MDWGCVAGKREFMKGRYIISVIEEGNNTVIKNTYETFVNSLNNYEKIGCLFVFNNSMFYRNSGKNNLETVTYLAKKMSVLTNVSVHQLINGGSLNKKIVLKCPVTGLELTYHDFDAIAFCPQAEDKTDPLYDPLMAAPYPCVNFNSDIFGFSILVRDQCLEDYGCEVYEISDSNELLRFFNRCSMNWHRMAIKTIRNYIRITDTKLCPTYLSKDDKFWFANHQDPAFAESQKQPYSHEMPVIYAKKIISRWMDFFTKGVVPDYANLSEAGSLL